MITLVTGASKSGKSQFAEDLIMTLGNRQRIYIATMISFDKECHERILNHRRIRAHKGFQTVECPLGIGGLIMPPNTTGNKTAVLLECLSNLLANEMYQPDGAGELSQRVIVEGIKRLSECADDLVIVTNEVFSDGFSYSEDTIRYMKYLGGIHGELARNSDRVVEVVYGIPLWIKGEDYESFI